MKIGIAGCAGRMGRVLLCEVDAHPATKLAGGSVMAEDSHAGEDIGLIGRLTARKIFAVTDPAALFETVDGVIDFTRPEASLEMARIAAAKGKVHIIGTTGFTEAQLAQLKQYADRATIVWSPNMSVSVNMFMSLVEQTARVLDPEYDIEILEMHHKHKVDAPSGTALALGEAAARGRAISLKDHSVRVRDGHTGERRSGDIGFATLRGGDVVGEHTVMFAGEGERLELTHKSTTRDIYARGAIRAALWANKQQPGFYSMKDVLGL